MGQTTGQGGRGRDGGDAAPEPEESRRAAAGSVRSAEEQEVAVGWKLAGLGFQVASEVGAGALLGWLVDGWLNSAPTGILIGSIVGIAVGLWSLIRGALKLNRQLDSISEGRKARSRTAPGPTPAQPQRDTWNDDFDHDADQRKPDEDDDRW